MNAMTPHEILGLPMDDNDSGANTIRGYLVALTTVLWQEGECFSGKRPFGTSGWDYDLYPPLIKAGLIQGSFDKYGSIDEFDEDSARGLIAEAIKALGELAPA